MTSTYQLRWSSTQATTKAGIGLAEQLAAGDLIGLVGDLGAGKTLLVQAIARGLAIPPDVRITSPTFALINEYHGGRVPLYHADLYRIADGRELDEIGLDELTRRGDGVVCVEWSDRYPVLGRDFLSVRIEAISDTERAVEVTGTGVRARALAQAWCEPLSAS